MSNNTQAVSTVQARSEIEYQPFGADEKIKLSLKVIKDLVAVPTKQGDLPDERDCMRFMMLCRSGKLNPFAGDCYLVGYRKSNSNPQEPEVNWSLITSIAAYYKRAELHPEFNGIQSGVIIRDQDEKVVEREGDLVYQGEELLGGWATVEFKTRKIPMKRKVSLVTYRKPFGVWVTDPAGMICKVAESQCLRDSFPTLCGGFMLREEITDIDTRVDVAPVKRAQLTGGTGPDMEVVNAPAPRVEKGPENQQQTTKPNPEKRERVRHATMVEQPEKPEPKPEPEQEPPGQAGQGGEKSPGPEPSTQEPPKQRPPFVPTPSEPEGLQALRRMMHESDVSEEQVLKWARKQKLARDDQKLVDLSTAKLASMADAWERDAKAMVEKIVAVK